MYTADFGSISPRTRFAFTSKSESEVDIIHSKLSLSYRLFAVTRGKCVLRMDGIEYMLEADDVVFLVPGQEYTTVFPALVKSTFVNICFDFFGSGSKKTRKTTSDIFVHLNVDPLDTTKYAESIEFTDMPEFNRSTVIHGIAAASERFEGIDRLYHDGSVIDGLRMNSELISVLADAAELLSRGRFSRGVHPAQRIIGFINEHTDERLTCREIAEHFSYHPNYCNRIVREYTGMSLHNYIVAVKIRRADHLLVESDLSITDIAYQLAFHDASHFSSVYQAQTGMKPSERRKLLSCAHEPPTD